MKKILAVYGTAYGQTEKIVRRLAATLGERGMAVTACKADALPPGFTPDGYDGSLVAASIIGGRHQAYVRGFVRAYRLWLDATPSAFVSVSGSAANATPAKQAEARRYVTEFLRETDWQPRITATFGGAMAYTRYGFFLRWMTKLVSRRNGGPTDTSRDHEFTDWAAVDRFAAELADVFAASTGRVEPPVCELV